MGQRPHGGPGGSLWGKPRTAAGTRVALLAGTILVAFAVLSYLGLAVAQRGDPELGVAPTPSSSPVDVAVNDASPVPPPPSATDRSPPAAPSQQAPAGGQPRGPAPAPAPASPPTGNPVPETSTAQAGWAVNAPSASATTA